MCKGIGAFQTPVPVRYLFVRLYSCIIGLHTIIIRALYSGHHICLSVLHQVLKAK